MDLENFAMEAQAAQAVVLLALHGGIGENGYVQAFLQGYRVPFTGPGWDAASVAIDKVTSPYGMGGGLLRKHSYAELFQSALRAIFAHIQVCMLHANTHRGLGMCSPARRPSVAGNPCHQTGCLSPAHSTDPVLVVFF